MIWYGWGMNKKHPIADFFDTKGKFIVILGMVLFAIYLLQDFGTIEADTRKYEIRCIDDNGLYRQFIKPSDEWWRTAHGTLVVMDRGRRYTFDRRSCTHKPIE